MVGADAARGFKRLSQGAPSPVTTDVQVVSRQPELLRHLVRRPLVQVDRGQHRGVFGPKRREERAEAFAEGSLVLPREIGQAMPVVQPLRPAVLDVPSSVGVDDCIPEDAVEPGGETFAVVDVWRCAEGAEESLLEDVLGEVRV
jgi:hypothetical protein